MTIETKELPYRALWEIVSSNGPSKPAAAREIRWRRKNGAVPNIQEAAYKYTDNQKKILELLNNALDVQHNKKIQQVTVSNTLNGGWVVYLTGTNTTIIKTKIDNVKDMVIKDANEFGSCRVCVAPVIGADWDGLLVRFDRGLRLVYE